MKKISILLLLLILLSGCSIFEKDYYFVKNSMEEYFLVDENGDIVDGLTYTNYEDYDTGFVVYQEESKGYLNSLGEELIEVDEYEYFEVIDKMIIIYDEGYSIYDLTGELLYQESDDTTIVLYDLPVVIKDGVSTVLYSGGKTLGTYEVAIGNVSTYGGSSVLVSGEVYLYYYELGVSSDATSYLMEQSTTFSYVLCDVSSDKGALVYDQINSTFALLNLGEVVFSEVVNFSEGDFDATTSICFDDGDNIVVTKEGNSSLYDDAGSYVTSITSYYLNAQSYIKKSTTVTYGPHTIVYEGTESEISGVQLDPLASYTAYAIYPVFLRNQGYVYYDFNGEQVFEDKYIDVTTFDSNGLAIVAMEEDAYYLINTDGNKISDEYVGIELINGIYYKGYVSENRYVIINSTGQQVITQEFMGTSQIVSYGDITYGIFENSARTYIYDMSGEYLLLFELQGDVVLDMQGLFVVDGTEYYTLLGKELYVG